MNITTKIPSFILRLFSKNENNSVKLSKSELEKFELENMERQNNPYHKQLEKTIINLSDNLANIKEFYENHKKNEYKDDLYDLEKLSKSLKILFEYDTNHLDYNYGLNEVIDDVKIISVGITALIQKKLPHENMHCEDVIKYARNRVNQRIADMLGFFTIQNIPQILYNDLTILIIGHARSGKSVLLNEMIKNDNNSYLLSQDKSTFYELNKIDYQKDIDAFEKACSENKNIYIDDVHFDLKEELIEKYFIKNENKPNNKIVAVYQGLEDIKNKSLIKKFDLIISTKSSSLIEFKALFNEEDLQRLIYVSNFHLEGDCYSAFNIKKEYM